MIYKAILEVVIEGPEGKEKEIGNKIREAIHNAFPTRFPAPFVVLHIAGKVRRTGYKEAR